MAGAIRPATSGDANAIAAVHVAAWRETYRGLVPDRALDGLSVQTRVGQWERHLAADGAAFVAELDATVVGFGACGPQRDPSLAPDGEIYAIYLLGRAQRRGLGRGLMAAMAAALRAQGRQAASLWVVDGNDAARQFYAAIGGRIVAEKVDQRDGYALAEVAYAWDRLDGLLASPR